MKPRTTWYISAPGLWWQRGRWVATLDPRWNGWSSAAVRTKRAAIRHMDRILAVDPLARIDVWVRRIGRGGRSWSRGFGVGRV